MGRSNLIRLGDFHVDTVSCYHVSTSIAYQPLRPHRGQAPRTAKDHALGVQDQTQLPQ